MRVATILIGYIFLFANLTARCCAEGDGVETYVEILDTLRPGSSEAQSQQYPVLEWASADKALVLGQLKKIHRLAPGLLPRGAADGKISVYLAKLRTYAKGGTQLIVLDRRALPVKGVDYSYRIVLHELVHTADSYHRLSDSDQFRKAMEPRIIRAREILKAEGLTPVKAAALPLGDRRKTLEQTVRRETGLPGIYACANLAECLAEVTSFWVAPEYRYDPPEEVVPVLREFVMKSVEPDTIEMAFREAENTFRGGDYSKTINQLSPLLDQRPQFYQAASLRGYAYQRLKQLDLAEKDLRQARDSISPYQSGYSFYDSEWRKIRATLNR